MANVLGAKPVVDTSEFKSGLAAMNADLRVLESGFKASTASMGNWAQTGTGLETRIKSLNSQMEIQRQKVALLKSEYERIKATKGEDAAATKNAEVAYNKSVETLGKMESELGQTETALTEMTTETKKSGDAAVQTGDKWAGLKNVLGGVAVVAKATVAVIVGLIAAVAAVAVAIGGLVFTAAKAGGALVDMSAQTGISTTRLQEMAYIGSQVGVSLDTIAGAQARLTRSMAAAAEGTGAQAEAFKALDVAVTNADGSLRSQQDVMADTFAALNRVENAAERDALAMALFGRSALELNPLIKLSAEEMAKMTEEAYQFGAVVSDKDVAALDEFGDMLDGMKLGLQGTLATLATVFLPGFQVVFSTLGGYLKEFSTIVSAFSSGEGGIQQLSSSLTGLVAKIATDLAAAAPQMMEAGLGIVMGILNAIMSALPSLLTAATSILTTLINFIVTALPIIIPMGIQMIMTLINAILTNLPMLVNAALQAVIALANGLAAALPTLIPAIVQAMILIVQTLIENIPLLVDAALALILGLVQGLVAAIPILIPAIPKIVQAIVVALVAAVPMILQAAGQLISTLITGLISAVPQILQAAWQIILILATALIGGAPDMGAAAGQMMSSLAAGLTAAVPKILQAAGQLIKSLVSGLIKGITQIAAAAGQLIKTLISGLLSGIAQIAQAAGQMIQTLVSGLLNGISLIASAGMELIDALINAIGSMMGAIMDIGRAIVEGVWQGIQNAADWFYDMIYNFFAGMIDTVLGLLGISSPSTVFAEIGINSMRGFAVGFEQEFKAVEKKIARAMGGLALGFELNPSFAGAGAGGLGGTSSQSNIGPFYAPVIISGPQTPGSLGAAIKGKRF